jgi:hemolysin-activating ACP:hemolysin acyltransferase
MTTLWFPKRSASHVPVPYCTWANESRPTDKHKSESSDNKAALERKLGNRIFASRFLFYSQNEAEFDKIIGRKTLEASSII